MSLRPAQKGAEAHGLGRSRGGCLTRIHLKPDFDGRPRAFEITGGEKAGAPMFETPLHLGPDAAPRAVVTDKGYDSRANRAAVRACGAVPVIPVQSNAANPPKRCARALHRGRARVEHDVGKLKRFKRTALRCETTKGQLRIPRRPRLRIHLGSMRPHGLAIRTVGKARATAKLELAEPAHSVTRLLGPETRQDA